MDADTKRYVHHLKIGRTSMISGRLLTSVSKNLDVLSTFCGRKYVRLDIIQNTGSYQQRAITAALFQKCRQKDTSASIWNEQATL